MGGAARGRHDHPPAQGGLKINYWQHHPRLATVVVILIGLGATALLLILSHDFGRSAPASTTPHEENAPVSAAGAAYQQADIHNIDFAQLVRVGSGQALEPVQYGDINGDGSPEAVVSVRTDDDNRSLEWYLYGMKNGVPARLFDRHQVAQGEVKIDGPRIIETEGVYGPSDQPCCPSSTKNTYYVWKGGELVVSRVDAAPPGAPS